MPRIKDLPISGLEPRRLKEWWTFCDTSVKPGELLKGLYPNNVRMPVYKEGPEPDAHNREIR